MQRYEHKSNLPNFQPLFSSKGNESTTNRFFITDSWYNLVLTALHVVALSLAQFDEAVLDPATSERACGLLVAILALNEVGIGELLWQLVVDAVVRPAAGRLHDVIFGSSGALKTRAEVEEDLFVQVVAQAIHHRAPSSSLELG